MTVLHVPHGQNLALTALHLALTVLLLALTVLLRYLGHLVIRHVEAGVLVVQNSLSKVNSDCWKVTFVVRINTALICVAIISCRLF